MYAAFRNPKGPQRAMRNCRSAVQPMAGELAEEYKT